EFCQGFAKTGKADYLNSYKKSSVELNESNKVLSVFVGKYPLFSPEIDSVLSIANALHLYCDKVVENKINNNTRELIKMTLSQNIEHMLVNITNQIFATEKKGREQLRLLEQTQRKFAQRNMVISYLIWA